MRKLFLCLAVIAAGSGVYAQTTNFNYTGALQTYTVPVGVTSIVVDVYGAQGGFGYNCPAAVPGLGGRVQATVAVTPGEILNIWVGGQGGPGGTTVGGTGGFNGGGVGGGWSGGRSGGGGGGASDIRQGGNALSNRIVVGAGGGGTGVNYSTGNSGGNGGGLTGADGLTGTYLGGGATQVAGGTPNGVLGNGGNATAGQTGGGGGGGYFGGGGSAWEGGGGGSSYAIPAAVAVVHTAGAQSGNGFVSITAAPPGAALNFDGANDYVSFPYFAPTANMTIEFNYKSASAQYGDIMAWAGNTNASIEVMSDASGGIAYGEWNGSAWNVYAVSTPVNNNAWHKISIVRTSSPNQVKIYVDGTLSVTAGTSTLVATNQFSIGMENWFGSMIRPMAPGNLDEVRIWRRALCLSEISNNLNCEIPTTGTNLEANLHFNHGIASANNAGITTLTDVSGNGHNGTLVGFALNGTTSNWITPGGVVSGSSCGAFSVPSVTVNPLIQTNIACFGGTTGNATVTASGGSGLTYDWTPGNPTGDGTASVSGLSAGTYTCTVTNDCGGIGSATFNITQPASPVSGSTVVTNIACFGGNTGAINLTPSGGTPGYTFNWLPSGPTTEDRTGLTAGTYSVQITDGNGCTATITGITVTQPTSPVSGTTVVTNVACFGGNTGAINLTPTGGTPGYTFNWLPSGPTTEDRTGLVAGTYSVQITDANGCAGTVTATVTQPSAIVVTPASQTNIACNGGSTGAASINTPTGGAGGYTYNWTPGNPTGDGTTSVTGLTAGVWTVTVTDANSCTNTATFNITAPSVLVATISSQTNVSCNGNSNGAATVTPSGGTAGYTYSWAPAGGTAATATGLTANCYTVTVTDANGCTTTQTVCITQPIALSITSTVTNVSCNAGSNGSASVSVMGGTPTYSYAWAPSGGTASTASGLTAGTYTCTVTDGNGCTITQSVVITEPTAVTSTNSFTDITCFGLTNGSASVSVVGGTSPYTYVWSPSGGNGSSATGLGAGMYTCTITDGAGCILSPTFLINEPSAISPNQMQNNISCNGGGNGHMMVSPSGGTGAYTYSWAPIANATNVLNGSPAGFYTCTITDANGCTATATFNLTQPSALSASTMQTNVLCNSATTGDAMVMVSGGTAPYTYAWSSGGTAATESGLGAGTYTCTVTDAFGCSLTQTVTITEPTAISLSVTSTNVSCNGGSDGSVDLSVSGGTAPYTFDWNSGAFTTEDLTNIPAGTYSVLITDANGCTPSVTVSVTEPLPFSPSSLETDVTCFGGNDGAIDITVTGGTLPYTYDWNGGLYTTEDLSGLSAGTYTIILTDANGCTLTGTMAVVQPSQIAHNGVATDATSCTANDGSIDLTTLGGTGPFTFVWSNAATTEDISGLDGGVYSVTITDSMNCSATATFTITEPGAPIVTYSEPVDTACGGSLPTPPFTLSGETPAGGTWTGPGVSGNTFDASLANIGMNTIVYSYTDANGCSGSATDSIWVDLCMDVNTISENTFTMYPNPTTGVLNIITNGNYSTIVVTDALGQQVTTVVTNLTTTQVDLSQNANGLYFVRVEQNGIVTTQRVMIAK